MERLQDVYGRLGAGIWDWNTISRNPESFASWLAANWQSVRGKFGNHRKYESLRPSSNRSVAQVVDSYLAWIGQVDTGGFLRTSCAAPVMIHTRFLILSLGNYLL